MLVRKRLQVPDGITLEDGKGKLNIGLGVLVAGLFWVQCQPCMFVFTLCSVTWETDEDSCIIRQRRQRHVERLVHLLAVALEELAAAYGTVLHVSPCTLSN